MDQLYNYVQVGSNCSQFTPHDENASMTNGTNDTEVANGNCLNCQHFKSYHCELDLYDKISANLTKYSSEL